MAARPTPIPSFRLPARAVSRLAGLTAGGRWIRALRSALPHRKLCCTGTRLGRHRAAAVLAKRAARGRFQYLKWSYGAAALLIGLLFLASRLYPFQEASSDLWLAGKAGLIGAAFSIALAIRGRTVALDTDLLDNVTDGTLRLVIGIISAGVILLLFASGILPSLRIGDANFSGGNLTWQYPSGDGRLA